MRLEPPTYSPLALDVMRGALAVGIVYALVWLRRFGTPPLPSRPVGMGRLLPLNRLLVRRRLFEPGAYVALIAFVLDRAVPVALLYLAAFLVVYVSASFSEGMVNHGQHLVLIVVVAQAVAAVAWNAADGLDTDFGGLLSGSQGQTLAWWSVQAIVAAYFTSGVTKLLSTSGAWIDYSPRLVVSASATLESAQLAGTTSRARLRRAARAVEYLVPRPRLARILFSAGLLVELAAPLALVDQNVRCAVGLGMIALHRANRYLMLLPFTTYQILVLGYLVLPRLVN